jgi:4-hydroxybenzoate polyprenyltransferase
MYHLGGIGVSQKMLREYLSLIRFSHTVFALPFAALATCWALLQPFYPLEKEPINWAVRVLGVLICMVTGRSAAMAFNRLVDHRFDAKNPRTSGRHLPAGILSRRGVWIFFAVNISGFLIGTLLFWPNWLPAALSLPVLFWICGYSFAKRFTSAAHLWLGAALALSPVCAWIAVRGEIVLIDWKDLMPALLLGCSVMLWVAGFDIIYACQDADVDRSLGLFSIPSQWGVQGALKLSSALHFLMWLSLLIIPLCAPGLGLSTIYYAAISVVGILLVRQHWIIEATDLSRVNEAFFLLNALISLGLTTVAAVDSLISLGH